MSSACPSSAELSQERAVRSLAGSAEVLGVAVMQLALGHLLTQGGNWLRRQHAAGRGEVDTASSEGAKRIKVDTDFTWGWRERERKESFQFLVAIGLKSDFFILFCLFSLCPSYTWVRLWIKYPNMSRYGELKKAHR